MLGRLVLLFILIPTVELLLLIQLGQWIGLMPTLGLIVLTGFVGAALARREGLRAFHRFSRSLANGDMPTDAALDGLSVLIGGAFLLTPGIVTDLVGFGLLLPPVRSLFKKRLVRIAGERVQRMESFQVRVMGFSQGPGGPAGYPGAPTREADATVGSRDPREIVVPPVGGDPQA